MPDFPSNSAVSFDWDEYTSCSGDYQGQDHGQCDADRASMITEGMRLQAERDRLRAVLSDLLEVSITRCFPDGPEDFEVLYRARAALGEGEGC